MSNSETDLIEIRHVGVTAKINSPLKRLLPECSTAETDEASDLFRNNNSTLYSKFTPSDETETTCGLPSSPSTQRDTKLLYEMHAERARIRRRAAARRKLTPRARNVFTKIEFKLHKTKRDAKKKQRKPQNSTPKQKKQNLVKQQQQQQKSKCSNEPAKESITDKENSFLKRLRSTLSQLFSMHSPSIATKQLKDPFSELEQQIKTVKEEHCFYPFDRGCADYMQATDSPPDLITDQLAERANRYATKFWAEIFGFFNIGVSLVIAFVLQFYRFVLFALVNTLLVGLLRMTSDYLLKPLLAGLFNGFLQPFFLLFQNIFSSIRDVLEPIADALNNFMKPFANLFESFRLFNAPRTEKFVKDA